jgi:hypothetical protein
VESSNSEIGRFLTPDVVETAVEKKSAPKQVPLDDAKYSEVATQIWI